ncbi:MAG: sulfatase [Planctomycetota bacterium]
MRPRTGTLWPACALGFFLLSGCGDNRPNIILISVDTLRADALGSFGYPRATTPHLDAFLNEAVVLRAAYAPEPHTLPSHVSLFTALHPRSHGVEGRMLGATPLAQGIETLATVLGKAGYTNAAFVNTGFLHPAFGLARGFEHYDYFHHAEANKGGDVTAFGRSAGATNRAVLEWLDGTRSRPFFLFVHYYDVHSDWERLPYDAPESYRRMFCSPEEERALGLQDGEPGGSLFLLEVNKGSVSLRPSEVEHIRALYDAGVRYTDDAFGELLRELSQRGLCEDSLIVVLADHGEEFMEHGKMLHSQLFEECVRIPAGVRFPRSAGITPQEVLARVRIVDFMPTILDFLHLDPPASIQGASLMPLIEGDAQQSTAPLLFNSSNTGALGITHEGWKLLFDPIREEPQLYDLSSDPAEERDVARQEPAKVETYLRMLKEQHTRLPLLFRDAEPAQLDEDTKRHLGTLGYGG